MVAEGWWDYTTLDKELLDDAAKLEAKDLEQLSREGFTVKFYDCLHEFYAAEAMEYIEAWGQSTGDNPAGICGPIGPTAQLPVVARIVNALNMKLGDAHFWGMDEWVGEDGKPVGVDHPLSFVKADKELCFDRIRPELMLRDEHMHFPIDLEKYAKSYDEVRCVLMQGGQGDVKHWAFNDPVRREGAYADEPMPVSEYRKLGTRILELHPLTTIQNARTSGGGYIPLVPTHAATVGPVETWKAETVSIWHPGYHDNPFGMRLSALMISKGIMDTSVPMSLLADHPNVRFNYYRGGLGEVVCEMH